MSGVACVSASALPLSVDSPTSASDRESGHYSSGLERTCSSYAGLMPSRIWRRFSGRPREDGEFKPVSVLVPLPVVRCPFYYARRSLVADPMCPRKGLRARNPDSEDRRLSFDETALPPTVACADEELAPSPSFQVGVGELLFFLGGGSAVYTGGWAVV